MKKRRKRSDKKRKKLRKLPPRLPRREAKPLPPRKAKKRLLQRLTQIFLMRMTLMHRSFSLMSFTSIRRNTSRPRLLTTW